MAERRPGRPSGPNEASNPLVRELLEQCAASGMTQREIAAKAGIDQSTIAKLHKRGGHPQLDFVIWLGAVFGWQLVWVKRRPPRAKKKRVAAAPASA